MVTLEEMKQFLRVDYPDDDSLIGVLISSAEELCASVARISVEEYLALADDNAKTAVLYAVAYLYEHREEADHHQLTIRSAFIAVWHSEGGLLMKIELLNVRIFISKNDVVVDAIGNHKNHLVGLLHLLCNSER